MLVLSDYPNADPYQKYVNADCVLGSYLLKFVDLVVDVKVTTD